MLLVLVLLLLLLLLLSGDGGGWSGKTLLDVMASGRVLCLVLDPACWGPTPPTRQAVMAVGNTARSARTSVVAAAVVFFVKCRAGIVVCSRGEAGAGRASDRMGRTQPLLLRHGILQGVVARQKAVVEMWVGM